MRKRDSTGRRGLRCELPDETIASGTRITLYGKRCALVEGHCGVVEMGSVHIRLKSACGVIGIRGSGMKIRELSLDAAMVTGTAIEGVAYDEKLDRGGRSCGSDA